MNIKISFVDETKIEFINKHKIDYDMGHRYSLAVAGEFVVVTTPRGERLWFRQSAISAITETIPTF